jgi:hypothetical protein
MDALPAKPTDRLDWIPLGWTATTAPETPVPIPALVSLNVTADAIQIRAKNRAGFPDEEEVDLEFSRDQIIEIEIILVPDLANSYHLDVPCDRLSRAIIRHRDPFYVVPFFESTFASPKAYYLKALAKALRERLGIEPTVKAESGEPGFEIF